MGNIRQVIKMAAQNIVLPLVYRSAGGSQVDRDLVVFADAHHDSRPENMELLRQQLEKDFKIRECYLDTGKAGAGTTFRFMRDFMKLYAKAGTVVICDNFLPVASCKKKQQTRVVQLWHACGALKKFGYDTEDDIPANYRGNVFQNIDLVTVSSEACIEPFASAMKRRKDQVQALGVSRSDRFLDDAWNERCRRQFYEAYPQAKGKKVVLWAPTFRGSAGDPLLGDFDLDSLQKELGEDYLVLARLHPHMEKKFGTGNCSIPTDELFPVTDVLIADYSSLIYEYLLYGKALVKYTPDYDTYTAKRGFYHPYEEIPGSWVRRQDELAQAVREADTPANAEKQKAFLNKFMSACDGHATERIAEWIREHR